jgi:hypothetical protein
MVIKLAISLRLSSDSNYADIKHFEELNVEYSVPLLEELFKAGFPRASVPRGPPRGF